MKKIILVNENLLDKARLRSILRETCDVLETDYIDNALDLLEANCEEVFSVIISAYLDKDKITSLVNHIYDIDAYKGITILFEVNQSDTDASQKALDEGAYDLIAYPHNPVMIKKQLEMSLDSYRNGIDASNYYKRVLFANQLINDSSSAVYACDANTHEILYVNNTCARMCGRSLQDATSMKCYEFVMKRHEPCDHCSMEKANYNNYIENEYYSQRLNKHLVYRSKLFNWGGKNVFVNHVSDETNRVLIREKWRNLANAIPSGVGIFTMHSNDRFEMTYINDGYYNLLKTTRAKRLEYQNFSFWDAVHPDDIERAKCELNEAIITDSIANFDLRVINGLEQYIWLNLRAKVAHRLKDKTIFYISYFDIDDIKKSKLKLEASSRALELANKAGNSTVWLYDIFSKELSYDIVGESPLGYGEAIQNVPESLVETGRIMPNDVDALLSAFEKIRRGEEKSEFTIRLLNERSNTYEWQYTIITLINDDYYGKPMAIGISINVDAEQEALQQYEREHELREQLLKDTQIYYSINLSTGVFEEYQNRIDEENSVTANLKSSKSIRTEILNRIYPEERNRVEKTIFSSYLIKAYNCGERKRTCVYRRIMPDGKYHWVKATVSFTKKPYSDEVLAFIFINDIDRETTEISAIQSIINEEVESIFLLEISTGNGYFIKSREATMGYTVNKLYKYDELVSNHINCFVIDEDRDSCAKELQLSEIVRKLETENTHTFDFSEKADGGMLKRKLVTAYYLDESRNMLVLTHKDITRTYSEAQHKNEILREAVETANEANEAKSNFISRVSHDLRTPLNAIIGLSELAKEERNPEIVEQYLNDVNDSGKFMLGLINDVLDISRIEEGRMKLNLEPYSINEFKRNLDTVILPLLKEKHIEFVFDMDETVPIITVDKLRFCQIFFNLLSNSAKFTEPGGKVEVHSKYLGDDSHGRCHIRFLVQDNGIGMSKEFLKDLFIPFAQEHPCAEIQGTGLGLTIVKRLVEAFGGSISVNSELGKGTEFFIDTYFNRGNSVDEIRVEREDFSLLEGLHILLVEDNAVNVIVAKKLLENVNCIVDVAADGLEGVEAFSSSEEGHYDAILMDVQMPVMDGLESTRQIRNLKRKDSATVPIIAMTANAFVGDQDSTFKAGMNAYIAKPVDKHLLYSTILHMVMPS